MSEVKLAEKEKQASQPKITVSIYLKSGQTLSIPCDEIDIAHENGKMISYEIQGMLRKHGTLLFVAVADIAAITYVSNQNF